MSTVIPKEHDYIGLSETTSKVISHDTTNDNSNSNNLKETELRLGLPGSQSPERTVVNGTTVSLFGKDIVEPLKNLVSGAKRGFSDAIDGNSKKWGFMSHVSINVNGSDNCVSPRPVKNDVGVGGVGAGGVDGVQSTKPVDQNSNQQVSVANDNTSSAPASKAQVVGWPPIRSFRKNTMSSNSAKSNEDAEGKLGFEGLYVKVSMDGAPYLRKVDLKTYYNYVELSSSLEKMFRCFTIGQCSSCGLPGRDGLSASHLKDLLHGSEYVLTYEDKDGDWMLVGDVPWEMFTYSCKRLRIMKGSEAIGLAPGVMEKCKNHN